MSLYLIGGFYFDSFTLLFWFDLFLEARAEILTKRLLVFWSISRHQNDISKLTNLYQALDDFYKFEKSIVYMTFTIDFYINNKVHVF